MFFFLYQYFTNSSMQLCFDLLLPRFPHDFPISVWISTIGLFVYIFGGRCRDSWKGFTMAVFKDLWRVVKLSLSSGFMVCLEMWYTAVLVLLPGYMKHAEFAIDAFWFVVCDIKKNHLKVGLNGQLPISDGELYKPVKVHDSFWSLEDGLSISVLLSKHDEMEWWKFLEKGESEIDTQKVEPESSKLSDLDPETQNTETEPLTLHMKS